MTRVYVWTALLVICLSIAASAGVSGCAGWPAGGYETPQQADQRRWTQGTDNQSTHDYLDPYRKR